MAKAAQPRRIGLDLGDRSLSALVLRPDGRLDPIRTELIANPPPEVALAALDDELAAARQAGAAPIEVVLTSSRSFSALRRRPRVALLLTEGFEDLLQLELSRPEILTLFPGVRLAELAPRELCLGVPERLGADGGVVSPLTSESLTLLRQRVAALEVSAVAVVLLHSYQNDAHERTVAEALAPLGLPISLSAALARIPDERKRAGATLLDACLAPTQAQEYAALRGAGCDRILFTDSAGDVVPAAQAQPLRQLLSAAAAGLRGVARIASAHGTARYLTVHGLDSFTVVALHDPGLLALAPRDRGPGRAPEPFAELPASELRIVETSPDLDAAGLEDVITAALTAITIERGHDPAAYPLLAYGSIKEKLATTLGERLGCESATVLSPAPFVAAYGALCAPITCLLRELLSVEASSAQQTGQIVGTLHALSSRLQAELLREGYLTAEALPNIEWFAEMRYHGQLGAGLILPGIGDGSPAASGETDLVVRFCVEHQRRYGFLLSECPVEIVALRVRVTLPVSTPSYTELAKVKAC